MSVPATLAASRRAQDDEEDGAGVDEDDEAGVEEEEEEDDGVDPLELAASLLGDELSLLPSADELDVDAVRDDEPRLSVL